MGEAFRYARERRIAPDQFEFQMLYGIRRDLQRRIVDLGYRLRLYVPYGTAWYPYFMRRLAERPANVMFLCEICSDSRACRVLSSALLADSRFSRPLRARRRGYLKPK